MVWVLLVVAGLLETCFALALKFSEGFSKPLPTLAFAVTGGASFWLLTTALKTLPVGTAYAVWTGIGAVGTAIVGIVLLGDPATVARLVSIGLIVAGVVGLNLAGGAH